MHWFSVWRQEGQTLCQLGRLLLLAEPLLGGPLSLLLCCSRYPPSVCVSGSKRPLPPPHPDHFEVYGSVVLSTGLAKKLVWVFLSRGEPRMNIRSPHREDCTMLQL